MKIEFLFKYLASIFYYLNKVLVKEIIFLFQLDVEENFGHSSRNEDFRQLPPRRMCILILRTNIYYMLNLRLKAVASGLL